jgi:hypothetical protein
LIERRDAQLNRTRGRRVHRKRDPVNGASNERVEKRRKKSANEDVDIGER